MATGPFDVYAITERGTNELKGGATTLTPHELELLVLVDGRRTGEAIASLSKAGDVIQVTAVLNKLVQGGYIRTAAPKAKDGFDYFFTPSMSAPSDLAMRSVEEEAAAGAAELKMHGYYVSIARRAKVQGRKERQLTVLVVEDEPLVAKYLKALFESDGHTVRTAANRQQIVDELPKSPMPDLVVLDLMLPDADGFDVLQRMKSHPVLSDIPVVIVTTQSTRESVMKGLALGADGYFTKPFEVDILMRGMKAVLGQLTGR